jgi:PKD repeat protein
VDVTRLRPRLSARWVGLAFVVITAAVAPPPAAAVVVHLPKGTVAGISLRAGVSPASITGAQAAPAGPQRFDLNGNVNYHNGPVIHSSAPYLVFWDPAGAIPASSRALLERFFTDVAADSGTANNIYGVIRQYTDSSGFADYKQTFTAGQVINDTQPYPALDSVNCPDVAPSYPTCITDAQLQAEITRLGGADGLPTGTGANAPIYFVVTPANVNVCVSSGTTPVPCADNFFCAYHSSFRDGPSGPNVLYASIPTLLLAHDPKGCQFDGTQPVLQEPNGNLMDLAVSYMSHEDNETLTDPLGTGWWDATTGNEIGDVCSATGPFDPLDGFNPNAFLPTLGGTAGAGTLYDQLINGHPYYTQSEWSNGDVNCEMRPSPGAIAAAFSAPTSSAPGAPVQFDPTATTNSQGYSSVTWNFGDGSAPAFTTASAPTVVSHAFATPGIYTVSLTLVDTRGNLATMSHQVTVGTPPSAAFVASPDPAASGAPVGFNASTSHDFNSGASIAVYSWSFGDGSVGSGVSPTHTYARPGTYTVTLAVRDSFGLVSAPVSQQVTVDEAPSARLAATSRDPEAGLPVSFSGARSSDPDGSIVSYRWQFGDGRSGSGVSPKHVYSKPGTYSVTLTVRDSAGFRAVATGTVTVAARITHASLQLRHQRRYLLVTTDGPGKLTFGKRSVHLRRAGTVRFRLSLSFSQQATLARQGKLVLELAVKFAPSVGAVERTTAKVTLT